MNVPRLPAHRDSAVTVFLGDARDVLAELPAASLDCCITSPPYWGLRDYRLPPVAWGGDPDCRHRWGGMERGRLGDLLPADVIRLSSRIDTTSAGGLAAISGGRFCRRCGAWLGSLGLEPTPELYVEHLVSVFREVRRVLKPGGTLWLNLGDGYAGSGTPAGHLGLAAWSTAHARGGSHRQERAEALPRRVTIGLKAKDLVGIPWRVAFALRSDGWYLRSDVIWSKPNPMPESVRDRPTRAHEYLFLLAPRPRYFYDAEAIRQPLKPKTPTTFGTRRHDLGDGSGLVKAENWGRGVRERRPRLNGDGEPAGANRRTVWEIATQPYRGAHFATFPERLVEPCILAGTSQAGCCPSCGEPWRRVVNVTYANPGNRRTMVHARRSGGVRARVSSSGWSGGSRPRPGSPAARAGRSRSRPWCWTPSRARARRWRWRRRWGEERSGSSSAPTTWR